MATRNQLLEAFKHLPVDSTSDTSLTSTDEILLFGDGTIKTMLATDFYSLGEWATGITMAEDMTTAISISGATTTVIDITGNATKGINFGATVAKGIDFTSATPTYAAYSTAGTGGRNNPFIKIGSWDDPLEITLASDHWIPIQVNLKNSGNAAFDVAAARLRVDTGATNATAAVGCLQLRQNLGHSVASSAILNASVNVSGAEVIVGTGSLLGGYFSIEGAGAIVKAGSNDCTVLVAVNNNTGATTVDNVLLAMQNGTGTTVTEIVKVISEHGTATSGITLEVTASTGTMTNGITFDGAMTTGINFGSTVTNVLDFTAMANVTNLAKFNAAGGALIANALVPSAAPDGTTVGADACLRVLIGATPYYIPLYDTLHA